MGGLRGQEILIIVILLILVFGWKRLPDAARSLGRSARVFKSEVEEMRKDGKEGTEQADDTVRSDASDTTPQGQNRPQHQVAPPPPAQGSQGQNYGQQSYGQQSYGEQTYQPQTAAQPQQSQQPQYQQTHPQQPHQAPPGTPQTSSQFESQQFDQQPHAQQPQHGSDEQYPDDPTRPVA